jgi:peptide/nickel transport system permease protein
MLARAARSRKIMRAKTRFVICGAAALHLAVIFAGFISPYGPAAQNRESPYAPPTRLHFSDASGFHLRPFIYASAFDLDSYQEDRTREYPIRFVVRGEDYKILWLLKSSVHLFGVDAPAHIFVLGSDAFGRDEFSRLLFGGQISLAAGVLATLLSLAAGTVIGTVSGYYGKWVDDSLMGAAELFLSLPWFYFLIAVRAYLPLHLSPAGTFFLLICVIGLIGWARPARLIRGVVLSTRTNNYISAARGCGASDFYLLSRHIVPATVGVLVTQAALLVPQYVAAEATLSFFGLGVSEPVPSWGNMLSTLQQYNVLISYGWLLAPAGALVVTSVIYWLLADAIHRVKSH